MTLQHTNVEIRFTMAIVLVIALVTRIMRVTIMNRIINIPTIGGAVTVEDRRVFPSNVVIGNDQ